MTANIPHADLNLEREVLGLIIGAARDMGRECLPVLERDVLPAPQNLMALDTHQRIWQALRAEIEAGRAPTPYELRQQLPSVPADIWAGVLNAEEASKLDTNIAALSRLAAARVIHTAASSALAALRNRDPEQVAAELTRALDSGDVSSTRPVHVSEQGDALDYLDALTSGRIPMISTGFTELDERLGGGLELGSYVLLGMSTNVGKTRMALNMVIYQLEQGNSVTYVSGEMKRTAGGARSTHRIKLALVLIKAGIPPANVNRFSTISPETRKKIADAQAWLEARPLYIHDRDMHVDTISSIARRMRREGQSLMVIDNLNHVRSDAPRGQQGWETKAEISEQLAEIAHSNEIVMLTLLQTKIDSKVKRAAELDEISDSKAIARPADLVLTAWRDVKEATKQMLTKRDPLTHGELYLAKKRHGVGGSVTVGWREDLACWVDLATTNPHQTARQSEPLDVASYDKLTEEETQKQVLPRLWEQETNG